MPLATLDGLAFRINPSSIDWNFQIKTHVENTIGGRVVQVLGATLSDITITGDFGQRYGQKGVKGQERGFIVDPNQDSGLSWRLAEAFVNEIRKRMDKQSKDATKGERMNKALLFEFPDYGWRFQVYIKSIRSNLSENAIDHTVGNFAYKYVLTLFVVADVSDNLTLGGSPLQESNGVIDKKKQAAINAYIGRISAGVGWKKSEYNDPELIRDATTGQLVSKDLTQADPTTTTPTQTTSNTAIPAPVP